MIVSLSGGLSSEFVEYVATNNWQPCRIWLLDVCRSSLRFVSFAEVEASPIVIRMFYELETERTYVNC